MTVDSTTQTGCSRRALIVTRGHSPCACFIKAATGNADTLAFTLADLTSPAMSDHLSRSRDTPASLFLFNGGAVTRLTGTTEPLDTGYLRLTCDPSTSGIASLRKAVTEGQFASEAPDMLVPLRDVYLRHTRRLLDTLVTEFIAHACDRISDELENAAEIREITRLKDMRFIFSSRQEQIHRDFTLQFRAFEHQLNPGPGGEPAGELRVVDQHVFEDWLELQMVATALTSEHANTLFTLNQMLNQLFRADINDRTNPLAPLALCTCLQFTIDRLGIARPHRRVLYLAFEAVLTDIWPKAAQALNRDLSTGGLRAIDLTSMPASWKAREAEEPHDTPRSDQDGDTPAPQQTDHDPARAPGRSILRLMGLQENDGSAPDTWPRSDPRLAAELRPHKEDLREALSGPGPSMAAAMRRLASSNPELEQALDQGTWEKVKLVDRLFEPLEHEPGLNGTLRDQLEQLRLPVFEVLLETSEFLDQENHPARTIINDLMRLCVAERSSSRNLEKTVTAIIDELIQADERDESLYRSVGTKLRKLVERQEQSFQRNSERIAKTLEGKERLRQTRLGVQRRLNMLLAGKPVPGVVLELLEAGWEQLIVLAVLREGPESQTATSFINIVDQIRLWLSGGEADKDLAFEKELESDALVQLIDRELRTVGDVSSVRTVVARLSRELHQHQAVESDVLPSYPINTDMPEEDVSPVQADSRWARRAREIDVGDWVEIALENGEKRRMRLVWGGPDVFRFVFLSPQGLGEASYDYGEFIDKLASGDAWLISQGEIPFVDQSLFDIVQSVYKKLNFEATHDALTGCLHRHDFEKQLAQVLATLADSPDRHSLMVFDIDEFNIINTTYGTHTGDELLRYFAQLLQEHGKRHHGECYIGRLGGNEFALLASNMPVEEALDFTERLRTEFRKTSHAVGEAELSATLSASVCPFDDTSLNAGSLINQANLALKAAKRRGGDSVEMVRTQASETATTGPQWVPEIDRSIRDGSLYLRAQKIIPLGGGKEGEIYELLLGLQDSSGQEISPQNYIEAAEQFRRSSRVDLWVVDEALGWMERNPHTIANINTLNVNLSGASLSDDAFLLELEARLKQHRSLTDKLCFEVTETSAVSNLHYAADFMKEMKRLGCRFALDDFGTGLSSYAYLQKLPVDYVKVDGVFVRNMATNLTNYALVRSITELCHFLDIKAIAEYVEDMETLELLKEIQVDYGQGFCIAKPRRLDSLKGAARAGNPSVS
ncbi:DUF1631 family protein [Marinobacter sp. HL-58]|uniref:DUF1631 family protein n=1 Tax=Marinobacter sp. HL-58 TaxID=1479237 RepID=UPI00068DA60A|nr:DUF1631 family protein [Marinobacter sp. HL-58]KPP99976.1 MAG: diguanylate cyclase (GGDEF) domain [Marinobacter sp. HL-58]